MIHINRPSVSKKAIALCEKCPDCGKRTRMIQLFYDYYGWDSTCIKCGRQWADGEWLALDFCRGVRQRNIQQAKERFRSIRS
jgi:hypothetical protein